MEKIRITRDQYEVLEFMAEVYGGVGIGSMWADRVDDDTGELVPLCAYGLAKEGGLINPRFTDLYQASFQRELPFGYYESDAAVDRVGKRLGLGEYVPTGTRVPFAEWAKEMNFEVVDE